MNPQSQNNQTTNQDQLSQDEAAVGQLITPDTADAAQQQPPADSAQPAETPEIKKDGQKTQEPELTTEEITPSPSITGSSGKPIGVEDASSDDVTPAKPKPASTSAPAGDSGLLDVKQQALQQLTPLVDKLDLPAEEKFDTYMMIIRASDDSKLVKPAFEAAQAIADDTKKAEALLDVINEINYLTQPEDKTE